MKTLVLFVVLIITLNAPLSANDDPIWGRLANPGFENQPVKSAFFFTGSCRDGVHHYYEYECGSNMGLYTIHPSDTRHLGWSANVANQEFAINTMIQAGINVVNMSSWGPRGTDNWAWWAPMQTSTYSHDELFDVALDKELLIAPYIESYAETPNSSGFSFRDCFPGDPQNPAPELVEILKDLINRYLINPQNVRWPEKWAQMYDQSGKKRYVFSIILVSSNQDGVTDQLFAEGFDNVAEKIYSDTGILIGFTLAIEPRGTYAPGYFKPAPETTGPWLAQQKSVLAIQCYIPEISLGSECDEYLLEWKYQFSSMWIHTGIPFIQDITSGYDAHIVFPGSVIYGNNEYWRNGQSRIIYKLKSQGLTFNAWNGYTEGYAGVPTLEYGDSIYNWASDLFQNFTVGSIHPIPGKIEAESYEQMNGVQTERTGDDLWGLNVGWMDDGDWMDYNLDVRNTGTYYLDLRIAKPSSGSTGEGQIIIDNNVLTTLYIPPTNGWQNWRTIQTTLDLHRGQQSMRLYVSKGGWNINWMKFKPNAFDYVHAIPGKIEAEDFEQKNGVLIGATEDDGGGVNVGWIDDGDWMDYYVDVRIAGTYYLDLRIARPSNGSPGEGQIKIGNDMLPTYSVLKTFSVPNTGGWQNWETTQTTLNLQTGKQKMRLHVLKGGWNINWMKFKLGAFEYGLVVPDGIKADDYVYTIGGK